MSTAQKSLLALLVVTLLASVIEPPFPKQMFLQHLPTVAFLIALPFVARRVPLSDGAFACLAAFLLFHLLGARYIYSYVPYDAWLEKVFGARPSAVFGFERNHYDRVVHFFFGVLWVRPVQEICERRFGVPRRFAWYTAFEFVLAFSMVYELFEWGLAMALSPANADAYNGQQGDVWDAQKDMSLALLGAGLALLMTAVRRGRSRGASALLVLLALLAPTTLHAAPSRAGLVSFQRVPIPDDVPAHLGSALAQDRDGFPWIGTQAGLVRFDGSRFRVDKSDPRDPGTLGGATCARSWPRRYGRLWAGTFSGGLSVYDPATETFARYRHVLHRDGRGVQSPRHALRGRAAYLRPSTRVWNRLFKQPSLTRIRKRGRILRKLRRMRLLRHAPPALSARSHLFGALAFHGEGWGSIIGVGRRSARWRTQVANFA